MSWTSMDNYEFVNVIGSTGKCLGVSAFKCFGSEFSYVAPGIVDLLDPEEMWQNIQPCKDEFMTLRGWDGYFPVYGKVKLVLDYNQKLIHQDFILAELDDPVVIGRDILQHY